ncbi:hypothetical protein FYK55_14680 [Roseiconus nitratireducens]|uniref:Uncharacterized protein n=1 Tax=Roseiconus nitratireducens TaxID=2605748 RepID=A0A5M6D8Y0_9BACT|nr:hypothetical protein [Roseiconus nitratireducens]KAA5542762.1 hypothetical protein FYK55_14680 [Roseiconus nitratireducens]
MTNPSAGPPDESRPAAPSDRFGIARLMLMVAGIAIAFGVLGPILEAGGNSDDNDPISAIPLWLRWIITVLGGVSLVGVPILLLQRCKGGGRFGPGKSAWFAQGMSSWLLWPPIVAWRVMGKSEMPWSSVCWLWGTPLMGLYVTTSLLIGGRLRRRRRGAKRQWSEQFGLVLACLWACTGLYLVALLYSIDLFRKR